MHTVNATDILRGKGFRATLARVTLLEFLTKARQPLTVAEIHKQIGVDTFDQVTLYRSLESFVGAGLVRRVDIQRGHADYYELADDHHHHLICTGCGTIKDFEACDYERIVANALKQARGFAKVNSHSLELFGLCNSCIKS